ncbi:MAG: DNA-formamidopyrimidine glycosylase [Bacilli bacterium]
MPEKPEVITVVRNLKTRLIDKKITDVRVCWDNIIEYPKVSEFCSRLKNQMIKDITCRGKWIVIELTTDYLLVHLRMEGKFFFREVGETLSKHEHVIITLNDKEECRFHDVRKFGKMLLLTKQELLTRKPLSEIGLEFDDPKLTGNYLKDKFANKRLPIKSMLLDQSIIAGIGNIYDDEILFKSRINPNLRANLLSEEQCKDIIINTKLVLDKAIKLGGTTIRTYTSSEGVHGKFQNELQVHGQEICPICQKKITKIKVGGRGTYYCENCQKE